MKVGGIAEEIASPSPAGSIKKHQRRRGRAPPPRGCEQHGAGQGIAGAANPVDETRKRRSPDEGLARWTPVETLGSFRFAAAKPSQTKASTASVTASMNRMAERFAPGVGHVKDSPDAGADEGRRHQQCPVAPCGR